MSNPPAGSGAGAGLVRAGALTGTPLAILLGAALTRIPTPLPSSAPVAAAPSATSSAPAPTAEQTDAPTPYCASRFLSPLRALAADTNDPFDLQTGKTVVEVGAESGALAALVTPLKKPQLPWLDRVDEVGSHISKRIGGDGGRATIETLIATVPDPVDSGLSYEFDVDLRALSRALEEPVGQQPPFFRDHGWLPWDDRAVETSKRRDSEECRHSVPGIALFRGGLAASPRIRVLLLVGESPTAGLRQTSMSTALDVQARLDKFAPRREPGDARTVRIIGPTFSGSAQSMRSALRMWSEKAQERVHFELVSGTATGSGVPAWLGTRRFRSPLGTLSDVSFSATTLPETTTECSYFWFLNKRLGVGPVQQLQNGQPARLQPLRGVATLSESGTEFGARLNDAPVPRSASRQISSAPEQRDQKALDPPCEWAPSSRFQFPFHISALRDAYEHLDQRETPKGTVARATTLDAPLHEARVALDAEAMPSDKTRAAEDVSLSNLLMNVSSREIRHLAIHATDIGDAIFLARKIRDVAPDVRLAFFNADALLIHPSFQREVLGSLVVSPYPFLGLAEFLPKNAVGADVPRGFDTLRGFERDNAQGLFNAALAQAGSLGSKPVADAVLLGAFDEYDVGSNQPLPVWISTVGRGMLVPNQVAPSFDCSGRVFGSTDITKTKFSGLCSGDGKSWLEYRDDSQEELRHDPLAARPHLWDLLFALLCLALVLDGHVRAAAAHRFARDTFPRDKMKLRAENDQPFDRAIARTKWELYAAIRSYVFSLAFVYMGCLYLLDTLARGDAPFGRALCLLPIGLSLFRTTVSIARFAGSFAAYARCVRGWRIPGRLSLWDRIACLLGFLPPVGRARVAHTSYAQLRNLGLLTLGFMIWFAVALFQSVSQDADTGWRLTLAALRGLRVTSGVSPAAPILVCMVCVYVWAVGRMQRLLLAHGLSRATPRDREADLVSTPIRLILYPSYAYDAAKDGNASPRTNIGQTDAGFTEVERDLLNAIWRPITGKIFPFAAATLAFFPVVLFWLKPFLTLEGFWGTALLGSGLALAAALVGVTLVQLVQYWLALERLLKRLMEHSIGSSFRRIPAFARDSLDHLLSRRQDENLRWAACTQLFDGLARTARALREAPLFQGCKLDFARVAASIQSRRLSSLAGRPRWLGRGEDQRRPLSPERQAQMRTALDAALARRIVRAASQVTELLDVAWHRPLEALAPSAAQSAKPAAAPQAVVTAEALEFYNQVAEPGRLSAAAGSSYGRRSRPLDSWRVGRTERRTRASRQLLTVVVASSPPPAERPTENVVGAQHKDAPEPDALAPLAEACRPAELAWLRSAEVFVATVVTLLVQRHIRQFRLFMGVTTGCSLLVLIAVTVYPFEPYRLLLTYTWVVVGSVVVTGLTIFVQMDRNTFVSHMSATAPNQLTVDAAFALRVFAWAVVPLLSVAAAQYPQVANFLFDLVKPLAGALR